MDDTALFQSIFASIMKALESRLHLIGSVLDADARKGMLAPNQYGGKYIYDKGNMFSNANYLVKETPNGMSLTVGSNVRYGPYVLGGKVPSWTPIKPLIAWVERKGLTWSDKKTGLQLKVEQMAYMIQSKIKREGIEPRNIYEEVIRNREAWIFDQLNTIEVSI